MGLSRSTAVLLVLLAIAVVFSVAPGSARVTRSATDTTAPTIQQPGNLTVASTAPLFTDVTFTVNATDPDNPPSEISIHCDFGGGAGKTFPSGTTTETLSVGTWTVTCTASDVAGNTSAAVSFTITVSPFVDTTPPVIQVNNLTVPASSAAGTNVFYNVGATDPDNPSSAITVTCDHNLAGGIFPIGITTVTCNAHDPAGNNAVPASFTITVTSSGTPPTTTTTVTTTTVKTTTTTTTVPAPVRDTTAPTIRQRRNITTDATSPAGAVVTYVVTATDPDTPGGQIVVSCSPAAGSLFRLAPKGKTKTATVTCNAEDPAGNTAAPATFSVRVLGVHDQLKALTAQVNGAANIAATRRSSLASKLSLADRRFASGQISSATAQLDAFMRALRVTPRATGAEKAHWLRAATRVGAVIA